MRVKGPGPNLIRCKRSALHVEIRSLSRSPRLSQSQHWCQCQYTPICQRRYQELVSLTPDHRQRFVRVILGAVCSKLMAWIAVPVRVSLSSKLGKYHRHAGVRCCLAGGFLLLDPPLWESRAYVHTHSCTGLRKGSHRREHAKGCSWVTCWSLVFKVVQATADGKQ